MGLEKNMRERWVYVVKRTCEVGGKPKGDILQLSLDLTNHWLGLHTLASNYKHAIQTYILKIGNNEGYLVMCFKQQFSVFK